MSEYDFLTYAKETDFTALNVGCKGSGKTHIVLQFLKWAYHNQIYEKYFFVLPSYSFEQKNSYDFITEMKKEKMNNVFIFTKFSQAHLEKLVYDQSNSNNERCFFFIDDSTGHVDLNSNLFKKIFTTARHIKISLWVCAHALKKILTPVIRANCDFVFMFNIDEESVRESIFNIKEFKNKDLKNEFVDKETSTAGHGLCIRKKNYSQVFDWRINTL
jgi:hypothetical protein